MKKRKKVAFLIIALLLFLVILNIRYYSNRDVKVENAVREVEECMDSNKVVTYLIRGDRNEILLIDKNEITIFDNKNQFISKFNVNINMKKINRGYVSPNGDYLALFSSEKELTIVNIDEEKDYEINSESETIIEYDGFNDNRSNIYLKYYSVLDEKIYYGYYDIDNSKFVSIDELDEDNYFDIYYLDKLKLKVSYEDESIIYKNLEGEIIYSKKNISKHNDTRDFNEYLKKIIRDDSFYYVDTNKGEYGRLMKYDFDSKKTYELKRFESFVSRIKLNSHGEVVIEYEYPDYTKILSEDKSSKRVAFLENKTLNIYQSSPDYSEIIYFEEELGLANRIYHHNFETGKTLILKEYPSTLEYKKEEIEIDDPHGVELKFYLSKQEEAKGKKTIIFVHGGPFTRYSMNVQNSKALVFSKLGYNVIELNYHGSSGLGKSYQSAVGGNLPKAALEDIKLTIDWTKDNLDVKSEDIALIGSSYGGYLSMMSKINFGDEFGPCVSLLPGSILDLEANDIPEHKDVIANKEKYDNWKLIASSDAKVGIIFNLYDPALVGNRNWRSRTIGNSNVEIIKEVHKGHTVGLRDFKSAIYYIENNIGQ